MNCTRSRVNLLGTVLALGVAACGSSCGGPNSSSPSLAVDVKHTATLNWTPVRRRTDGTKLTNLAGYNIYSGKSPRGMSVEARPDATVTSYKFTNLSSGKWYFAVAAVTSDGVEGNRSNVVSKTIQ
jgi:hypothetical protein